MDSRKRKKGLIHISEIIDNSALARRLFRLYGVSTYGKTVTGRIRSDKPNESAKLRTNRIIEVDYAEVERRVLGQLIEESEINGN